MRVQGAEEGGEGVGGDKKVQVIGEGGTAD